MGILRGAAMWIEFTADIIHHRVREVTNGTRFSVTLFTPNHLERLTSEDWMNLESFGFPVQLYSEMDSTKAAQSQGRASEATEKGDPDWKRGSYNLGLGKQALLDRSPEGGRFPLYGREFQE